MYERNPQLCREKRNTFSTQLQAMDIDNHEKMEHWRGGEWQDADADAYPEGVGEVLYFHKCGKMKGYGKGKGFPD